MKLDKRRIKHFTSPLVSFTGDRIIPRGIVTLIMIASTYQALITKEIDFLIVGCPSTYNIILGRPALNRLRAATPKYYLKVINEPEPIFEPSETPQEVEVTLGDSSKVLKIGLAFPTLKKEKMISLLRANQDVFTWKHEDMLGIDRKIIQHRPNVNLECKPVQQKQRIFTLEHNKAVTEEVEKLLEAGFIREVFYLD
ncbi:uncharacterized protein LOC142635227 [Castanea sativa]|uniref:uncharacterized protein LOC142635227 n=1 Tax=Castanea sativa TaxID=21020 RepID=UPI003F649809